MNGLLDCCNPCAQTTVVNIPGGEGQDGTPGTNGSNGTNSFSFTTADFVVPAVAADVTVLVANSTWMVIGQKVITQGPATFQVQSKPGLNSAVLRFMGYDDDLAPGATIPAGSQIGPSGVEPDVTGFAHSGVNNDITSMTGLTTPIPLAEGGTNATNAVGARSQLKLSRSPIDFVQLQATQLAGTDGGSFATGAVRTHPLDGIAYDSGGNCIFLGGGQFSLSAGTYRVFISSCGYQVGNTISWLQNVTDAQTLAVGCPCRAPAAVDINTYSFGQSRFTILAVKTFELQGLCSVTNGTSGYGKASNLGKPEIYAYLMFEKEVD